MESQINPRGELHASRGPTACLAAWEQPGPGAQPGSGARPGTTGESDSQLLGALLQTDRGPPPSAGALLSRAGGWAGLRRLIAGPLHTPELTDTERHRLACAFEMARRLLSEPPSEQVLKDPGTVAARYRGLGLEEAEHLVAVGLDAGRRILIEHRLGGVVDGVHARPGDLLRPLIAAGAVAMIAVHNHPSRCPEPSAADLSFTDRLAQAGALCGVELLDHVIIAGAGWTSLACRGHVSAPHG